MGELIRIGAEEGAPGLSGTIDTFGAWITTLSYDGIPIVFPRQDLIAPDGTPKTRGGIHLCSPYFANIRKYTGLNEPNHGYAREVEWTVESNNQEEVVLSHIRTGGVFDGLESRFLVKCQVLGASEALYMELSLTNRNSEDTVMLVSPGFHPYFDELEGFDDLETDIPEVCFEGISFSAKYAQEFSMVNKAGVRIAMASRTLGEAVKWTDRLEDRDYTCVEPVYSTMAITDDQALASYEQLRPTHRSIYDLLMSFENIG